MTTARLIDESFWFGMKILILNLKSYKNIFINFVNRKIFMRIFRYLSLFLNKDLNS